MRLVFLLSIKYVCVCIRYTFECIWYFSFVLYKCIYFRSIGGTSLYWIFYIWGIIYFFLFSLLKLWNITINLYRYMAIFLYEIWIIFQRNVSLFLRKDDNESVCTMNTHSHTILVQAEEKTKRKKKNWKEKQCYVDAIYT